jgi:hypothetical protein
LTWPRLAWRFEWPATRPLLPSTAACSRWVPAPGPDAGWRTRRRKSTERSLQVFGVLKPDAIGHELVKDKPQLRRPAGQGQHELGVEERLAPREPEHANPVSMSVFQKTHGQGDIEPIRPLDRQRAVRAEGLRLVHRLEKVLVKPCFVGAAAVLFLTPARHGNQDHALAPRLLPDAALVSLQSLVLIIRLILLAALLGRRC